MGRIDDEKATVGHLIELYCRGREGNAELCGDCLCDDCRELLEYAERRLDSCRYGESKPACKKCPTHCYRPEYRAKIREVMRYAGPRLLWRHPLEAVRHLFR
jgi:hypothetical protein